MQKITSCLAIMVWLFCAVAASQEDMVRVRPDMTPQLALATLQYSEAGLVTRVVNERTGEVTWRHDEDMRAIHAVLLRGAERMHVSYLRFAAMYARGVIGRSRTVRRSWLLDLHPDGRQPGGWPEIYTRRLPDGTVQVRPHSPWANFRQSWLNTYERAGQVVGLRLDDWGRWGVCADQPDDWGGEMDHERSIRIGLIEVDCENTDNKFYVRRSSLVDRD